MAVPSNQDSKHFAYSHSTEADLVRSRAELLGTRDVSQMVSFASTRRLSVLTTDRKAYPESRCGAVNCHSGESRIAVSICTRPTPRYSYKLRMKTPQKDLITVG